MAQQVVIDIQIKDSNGIKIMQELERETSNVLKTITDLEIAQEKFSQALKSVEIGSKEYGELQRQLQIVNNELANIDLANEAMDSEKFGSAVRGLAGGLTDVAGGLALIGVSGSGIEEIAKTFAQVEGVSKVIGGSLDIYNEGLKVTRALVLKAAAAHTAAAAATTAEGNATVLTTVKMRALNLVMNANPVLLLVTGIIALSAAMYVLGQDTDDLKTEYDNLNKTLQKTNSLTNEEIEGWKRGSQQALALAEARGASETDIYNAKLDQINTEEQARLTAISSERNAIVKLRRLKSDAIAADDQETVTSINEQLAERYKAKRALEALEGESNSRIEILNAERDRKARDEAERRRKEAEEEAKKIRDAQLANSQRLAEERKKLDEDEELRIAQSEEQRLEIIKNRQVVELRALYEVSRKTIQDKENLNNALNDLELKHIADIKAIQDRANAEASAAAIEARDEYLNQLEVENELIRQNSQTTQQNEIDAVNDKYFYLIEKAKEYGEDVAALENEQNEQLREIDQKYADEQDAKRRERAKANFELAISTAQQTSDLIAQIFANQNEKEAAQRNASYDASTEALNNSLANRLISEDEYNTQVERLDQRKREAEKKARQEAFKQEKALALVNAIMNTAQAVVAGLATGGPPLAIVNGALGALQIGIIASRKFTAARGGIVPGNGSGHIDSVDALLAPGEAVINARSTSMFAPILSQINEAGGGSPLIPEIAMTRNTNSISNQSSNQPIRAYVVESELSETQNRVSRLQRGKKFQ